MGQQDFPSGKGSFMMVLRTSKYRCYEYVGINIFLDIGSGKYYCLGGPVYVLFISFDHLEHSRALTNSELISSSLVCSCRTGRRR